jgi:hypothetical protein
MKIIRSLIIVILLLLVIANTESSIFKFIEVFTLIVILNVVFYKFIIMMFCRLSSRK